MTQTAKIIIFNELQKLVPLSRTTIWRMEKEGSFPKRVRIGARRVGWRLSEVNDWIEARGTSPPG